MLASLRFLLVYSILALVFVSCSSSKSGLLQKPDAIAFKPASTPVKPISLRNMARMVNIKMRLMPKETVPRRAAKKLRPTFITIHSTGNRSSTATAMGHVRALNKQAYRGGTMDDRSWHFTADRHMVAQHVPLNETTWHAGNNAGNNNSLSIEMCETESRSGAHFRTWDRTARLTALLMKRYNISLRYVVPHYYWTKKNCPSPLLDNKRPGRKWAWFISRVDYYYRCLNGGRSNI